MIHNLCVKSIHYMKYQLRSQIKIQSRFLGILLTVKVKRLNSKKLLKLLKGKNLQIDQRD